MVARAKKQTGTEHTLVMLSGGADSTAALWYVLHNSERYGQVHIHHVHIQNIEGRWKVEAQAVKEILTYVRAHAPTSFTSSESALATPSIGKEFLYDTEVVSFITGYMTSRDPSITKVVIGGTGDDFARGISNAVTRGRAVHNAFHEGKDHNTLVKEYPLRELTKQQAYDSLPTELARLTWSCRTPIERNGRFIECGTCKTCRLELRRLSRAAI